MSESKEKGGAAGAPGTASPGPGPEKPVFGAISKERQLPPITLRELPTPLQEAAARANWSELMPVQSRAMPYLLAKRDLMVQSRTGSGKTGAFVLPMLARIDAAINSCQALVLVPTRELAHQVHDDARLLSGGTVRVAAVYGGVAYGPQLDALKQGAHIVVGTPGRILDLIERGAFSLKALDILVFDEADRMLSMGFYPDMKRIQRHLPAPRKHSAYMFSATFPPFVLNLAGEFLREPELLSLSLNQVHVAQTEHVFCLVPGMQKERSLIRIIEAENPDSAIIFCNTKDNVHYVASVLKRFGYDADALSSDLSQQARERVMRRAREGNLRFLVATDVAARGIDIPALSHVFLYEAPEDPESYVHRAGRTGRAGAAGRAVTLVSGFDEIKIRQIAETFNIEFQEIPLPAEAEVEGLVGQRLTAILEARLRSLDKVEMERMQRFLPLAISLGQSADEVYLVAMLLDDLYVKSLQAPPPKLESAPAASEPPRKTHAKPRDGRQGNRRR